MSERLELGRVARTSVSFAVDGYDEHCSVHLPSDVAKRVMELTGIRNCRGGTFD
jgi:hypothetical protein